jgi:hypothetical protein
VEISTGGDQHETNGATFIFGGQMEGGLASENVWK